MFYYAYVYHVLLLSSQAAEGEGEGAHVTIGWINPCTFGRKMSCKRNISCDCIAISPRRPGIATITSVPEITSTNAYSPAAKQNLKLLTIGHFITRPRGKITDR